MAGKDVFKNQNCYWSQQKNSRHPRLLQISIRQELSEWIAVDINKKRGRLEEVPLSKDWKRSYAERIPPRSKVLKNLEPLIQSHVAPEVTPQDLQYWFQPKIVCEDENEDEPDEQEEPCFEECADDQDFIRNLLAKVPKLRASYKSL